MRPAGPGEGQQKDLALSCFRMRSKTAAKTKNSRKQTSQYHSFRRCRPRVWCPRDQGKVCLSTSLSLSPVQLVLPFSCPTPPSLYFRSTPCLRPPSATTLSKVLLLLTGWSVSRTFWPGSREQSSCSAPSLLSSERPDNSSSVIIKR